MILTCEIWVFCLKQNINHTKNIQKQNRGKKFENKKRKKKNLLELTSALTLNT